MLKFILKKLFWGGFHRLLSDRQYIKIRYWIENGIWPDLDNPGRLSEKVHYIKVNEQTPLRKLAADRLKVRDYVAEKVGEGHLIPMHGQFDSLTKENWDKLPQQFVLKANHGSAMVCIVQNKEEERFEEVKAVTEQWLRTDYSEVGREWIYKDVPRKIIAEKLITGPGGSVAYDFKFFCFHGKARLFHIDMDRFDEGRRNFFDEDFKPVDVTFRLPPKKEPVTLPSNIGEAKHVAEKLSEDFNFIRVDLYITEENIWFGELTNYPGNGFSRLLPDSYDLEYGELLRLDDD